MATTNQPDPWRLDIHVIQNLIRTGEQGTHWDKTNKNWPIIIFSFSQYCVSYSYDWGVFGPRE